MRTVGLIFLLDECGVRTDATALSRLGVGGSVWLVRLADHPTDLFFFNVFVRVLFERPMIRFHRRLQQLGNSLPKPVNVVVEKRATHFFQTTTQPLSNNQHQQKHQLGTTFHSNSPLLAVLAHTFNHDLRHAPVVLRCRQVSWSPYSALCSLPHSAITTFVARTMPTIHNYRIGTYS